MSYHDRVFGVRPEYPPCWGRRTTYDPNDNECQDCRYVHGCRNEVERGGGGYEPYRRNVRVKTDEPRGGGVEVVNYKREDQPETRTEVLPAKRQQPAVERFFKDAVGGALRGAFYEMYQFWTRYRIP